MGLEPSQSNFSLVYCVYFLILYIYGLAVRNRCKRMKKQKQCLCKRMWGNIFTNMSIAGLIKTGQEIYHLLLISDTKQLGLILSGMFLLVFFSYQISLSGLFYRHWPRELFLAVVWGFMLPRLPDPITRKKSPWVGYRIRFEDLASLLYFHINKSTVFMSVSNHVRTRYFLLAKTITYFEYIIN